ncbi:clarin-3 [Aplochiton taeniatus]
MPSLVKILYFFASASFTASAVALLGFGMSAQWSVSTMLCSPKTSDQFNGTAEIAVGLFKGKSERSYCPYIGSSESFTVLTVLGGIKGVSLILHALVITMLALCLLCSAGSIIIALYNSVSNPYETYMGPIGLYACSSVSACLSFLVLILYVVNVQVATMPEDLVLEFASDVNLIDKTSLMGVGYFMLVPYMVLSLLAITMVFLYEHAAYTHRREQQRPTEDAPKEIMMY